MGRVECSLDVFRLAARNLTERAACYRRNVLEIFAGPGATHLLPMKLS
jgi:hypothetical protein